MAAIDFLGKNNVYLNAVKNCHQVIKENFTSRTGRKLVEIYDEDMAYPKTPSVCILAASSVDDMRSSQNMSQIRYTINVGLEVWYYHADLTEETKRNEITYILWELNYILKENKTLNGFAPQLGIEVTGARWAPRARGNKVLAGGVITLIAKKLFTSTITS